MGTEVVLAYCSISHIPLISHISLIHSAIVGQLKACQNEVPEWLEQIAVTNVTMTKGDFPKMPRSTKAIFIIPESGDKVQDANLSHCVAAQELGGNSFVEDWDCPESRDVDKSSEEIWN